MATFNSKALHGFGSLAALLTAHAAAGAESSPAPDKRSYTLFNPTPEMYLRDMSADRPDKTDCPFTVDAGHFQIETDFANLTHNRPTAEHGSARFTSFEIVPMNV